MSNGELRRELRDEAKRLYIDANYTSRGHYKDAAAQARLATWFGVPTAALGGLGAALGGAGAIFTDQDLAAGVVVLLSALLTSVSGFMQPEKKAAGHGIKAGRYKGIRDDALFLFKVETLTDASDEELRRRLKTLRQQYKDLALVEPHLISRDAYEKAGEEIERGEANYKSDPLWKELDEGANDGPRGV